MPVPHVWRVAARMQQWQDAGFQHRSGCCCRHPCVVPLWHRCKPRAPSGGRMASRCRRGRDAFVRSAVHAAGCGRGVAARHHCAAIVRGDDRTGRGVHRHRVCPLLPIDAAHRWGARGHCQLPRAVVGRDLGAVAVGRGGDVDDVDRGRHHSWKRCTQPAHAAVICPQVGRRSARRRMLRVKVRARTRSVTAATLMSTRHLMDSPNISCRTNRTGGAPCDSTASW